MSNLDKAISVLNDLLDEMADKMDMDANGNPDDAMRWANQLSDALVRLKRTVKADTKTHTDLCQREAFEKWLQREMPAGAVISDPLWWAPKILQAAQATPPAAKGGGGE